MNQLDDALYAYEQALRHNMYSTQTLNAISTILRTKEKYPEAMEYLKNIIKMEPANGDAWGNLGHCHLMMDNLQDAYTAYQQALYYLPDPKVCPPKVDAHGGCWRRTQEPKLWYGIGILYDRYGSLEHAEEAFSQVMRMQPDFEKANEIYFRLGIIYKQQSKFQQSLEVRIASLKSSASWYVSSASSISSPILHVPWTRRIFGFKSVMFTSNRKMYVSATHAPILSNALQFESAKAAYKRVLERDPRHAKVLQQLGWLHHQQSNSYSSQEQAIEYLEKSVGSGKHMHYYLDR
jgi:general transcriptional corepressor CYC8